MATGAKRRLEATNQEGQDGFLAAKRADISDRNNTAGVWDWSWPRADELQHGLSHSGIVLDGVDDLADRSLPVWLYAECDRRRRQSEPRQPML